MRKQNRMIHAPLGAANLRLIASRKRYGRLMKDPEGEHGQQGNQQENNQGGNGGGQNGNGDSGQNNGGGGFDPTSFWNEPKADPAPDPSGTAGGNQNGGGQSGGNQDDGNAFAQRLTGLTFGTQVFTPEAVEAMNTGDASKFTENMTKFGRDTVKESVVMSAQLMQRNNQLMESRFEEMLNARFGQRDAEGDLGTEFPSYKDPDMKPVIDGIFTQAMKLAKGNRKGAVEMTREMLKHTTGKFNKDLNLNTAPGGPGDSSVPVTNWEEELLGRS